jgi:hypothetical protein
LPGLKGEHMGDDITDENKKIRRLRYMVDFSLEYIRTQRLTHDQAILVVEGVKRFTLNLFPGKEETFDLIYAPRFKRLLNEKFQRS